MEKRSAYKVSKLITFAILASMFVLTAASAWKIHS